MQLKQLRLHAFGVLLFLITLSWSQLRAQDVIMQGFYWNTHPGDITNTTTGGIWWDTIALVAPQLGGAGFKTIWTPPPTKGFAGVYDMGYGPYDYFDLGQFNSKGTTRTRHGSFAQLSNMISALHNNGVQVMADIVLNHRGGGDAQAMYQVGGGTGYTIFTPPSGRMFSGPQHFHPNFFHPDQNPDYHNPLFFEDICYFNEGDAFPPTNTDGSPGSWFFGAPGVTQLGTMGDSLIMWGRWLVNEVGFDEVRLDAVKHIEPDYLAKFIVETRNGAQPFTLGEDFDYGYGALSYYHNAVENSGNSGTKQANLALFDFPLRGALRDVLNNGSGTTDMYQVLGNAGLVWNAGFPGEDVVTWLDTHDTDRTGYITDNGGCSIPYGGSCLTLHTENDHNPIFQDKEDMGYPFLMAAEGRPMVFWKDWYWYGLSKDIKWLMALRNATATGSSNHIQQMGGFWPTTPPFDGNNHGGNMFALRRNGTTNGVSDGMVLGLNDHPNKTNGVYVNTPFSNKYLKDYSDGFLFQSSYAANDSRALIKAQPRDYSWWAPTGLYPSPPDVAASHFSMNATPGGCPHFIALRAASAANLLVNGAPIANGDQVAIKNTAGQVVGIGRIGQGFAWDGTHDMIIEVLGSPSSNGMMDGEAFRIFVYDVSAGMEIEVGAATFAGNGFGFNFAPERPNSPNRNGNVPNFGVTTTAGGAFVCGGISLLLSFDSQACGIIAIQADTQSACNSADNTYSQQLVVYYINPPMGAQLVVNGNNFPLTGSPQTVTLSGLSSDGLPVDVTAYFSNTPACSLTEDDLFNAPPSCTTFLVCGTSDAAASAYNDGWQSGDDDGNGFGGWQLSTTGPNAGHFVASSTGNGDGDSNGDGDINTSGRAWGMYANSGNVSNAIRPFDVALTPGSTFRVRMDNGWIELGGTVGFGLQDASGNNRMEFYFRNGQANYKVNDNAGETDTGLGFSDEGLSLTFTLLTTTTYRLEITKLAGGTYTHNGTLINPGGGQPIARFRGFNANAGFDGQRNAYFNSMEVCTPQAPCSITNVTAGTQYACDPETNTYSQQVTITFQNPPPVGQLSVNGQLFAIGSSPQTVTLTGLESDGQSVNVNVSFTASPGCNYSASGLFSAPASCLPCDITGVSAGSQSGCEDDFYSQQIGITYENPPSTGTLIVNGQNFPITGSPQTVTLTGLAADGQPVNVSVSFSDDNDCAAFEEALFTAPPPCPACQISGIIAGSQTACNPQTNTYTQAITINYTIDVLDGFLVVNGQYFPLTGSPQTVVLAGLSSDGQPVDVDAYFTDQEGCTYNAEGLFTAPAGCADEGQCGGDNAAASAYNDGWQNGDNSGSNFGAWQLSTTGPNAGYFVYTSTDNGDGDGNADGDIDTGNKAWGMYANSGNVSNAVRPFTQPMAVGDLLRFRFDNGWIDNGGTVGFGLRNASGANLLEFFFIGGNPTYKRNDANGSQSTGIGFTDEGFDISISLLAGNTYEMTVVRLSDGFTQSFSGPLMNPGGGQAPAQIRFFNANAGGGNQRNAYANSLSLCRVCNQTPMVSCNEATLLLNPMTNTITINATALANPTGCGPFTLLADGQASLTFDCEDLGPHQVVVTAEDSKGQMVQCNATVVVGENVAPTVNCKPATVYLNAMGQATLSPSDVFLNGTDNCGAVTPQSVSPGAFTCADLGTQMVTLTAVDGYANQGTCTAMVTVADNLQPSITAPPTATVYKDALCGYNADPSITGMPTVGDNCPSALTTGHSDALSAGTCVGNTVITRTWTVDDGHGNTNTVMQTIQVLDNIAPQFTTHTTNGSGDCGDMSAFNTWLSNHAGAVAQDNCSGVTWLTPQLVSSSPGCGYTTCQTYLFNVVDACNNMAGETATFCYTDHTGPILHCRNTTVYIGESGVYTLQNANVLDIEGSYDNCGAVHIASIGPSSVSCSQVGTTIPVVVTATDDCGNTSTCTAQITVAQNTGLPVIWSQSSVGNATGSAQFLPCAEGGEFTVSATGFSTTTQDGLYQVYRSLCGDGQITARVASISATGGWAGVFMRENATPGSRKVALKTQLGTFVRRDSRSATNGPVSTQQYPVPQGHQWLRLVRGGNTFSLYTSDNGVNWVLRGVTNVAMANCITVGLFTESINVNTTTTAVFDNVTVTGNAALAADAPAIDARVEQKNTLEIPIYPNPTTGQIQVDLHALTGKTAGIQVINNTGQLVLYREKRADGDDFETIDLSTYSEGLYLLRILTEEGDQITQKVIVTR